MLQGIQGVRFKRLIMDESVTDRSPHPPQEPDVQRAVFCSGKVCPCPWTRLICQIRSVWVPDSIPAIYTEPDSPLIEWW